MGDQGPRIIALAAGGLAVAAGASGAAPLDVALIAPEPVSVTGAATDTIAAAIGAGREIGQAGGGAARFQLSGSGTIAAGSSTWTAGPRAD